MFIPHDPHIFNDIIPHFEQLDPCFSCSFFSFLDFSSFGFSSGSSIFTKKLPAAPNKYFILLETISKSAIKEYITKVCIKFTIILSVFNKITSFNN